MEYIVLNNGMKLPSIGFGTANARDEQCKDSVKEAIRVGYQLIDTASQYKNEEAVGKAVAESTVDRSDLIISTKLWNDAHGYKETYKAYEESAKWMKMDTFDMFLIHWPNPVHLRNIGYEAHNAETWRAMEEIYEAGHLKVIGVSNFQIHHLEAVINNCKIVPMVNQICVFPGHIDWKLVEYCRNKGIVVQAYCPLAAGRILNDKRINGIASKYNKSTAQVCLRWHIQNGIVAIPKSVNPERIQSNLDIFDFELSQEDMDTLNAMKVDIRILPDPDEADF